MRTRPRAVLAITIVELHPRRFIAVCIQPALLRVGTLISLLTEETPSKPPVPVQQVASKDLEDTWGAPRIGNRRHEGIDIFAPLGRPVLSTGSFSKLAKMIWAATSFACLVPAGSGITMLIWTGLLTSNRVASCNRERFLVM